MTKAKRKFKDGELVCALNFCQNGSLQVFTVVGYASGKYLLSSKKDPKERDEWNIISLEEGKKMVIEHLNRELKEKEKEVERIKSDMDGIMTRKAKIEKGEMQYFMMD